MDISASFNNFSKSVQNGFGSTLNGITKIGEAGKKTVINEVTGLSHGIKSGIIGTHQGIKSGIRGIHQGAKNTIKGIKNTIGGTFNGITGPFKQIGQWFSNVGNIMKYVGIAIVIVIVIVVALYIRYQYLLGSSLVHTASSIKSVRGPGGMGFSR